MEVKKKAHYGTSLPICRNDLSPWHTEVHQRCIEQKAIHINIRYAALSMKSPLRGSVGIPKQ